MSHGDSVAAAPAGFTALAGSAGAPVAAFEDAAPRLAGVQWHPEVLHTQAGQRVLESFLYDIAGCSPDWTPANIVDDAVQAIRAQVGGQARDLRAVRRGGLGGGRGAGAAGGRQPADLRVRRPRSAAPRRGGAGGAGLRGRHRGRPEGGRRGRPVPRRPGRGDRPRDQAQDHRPGVHPDLRGRGARGRGARPGRSSSWSRAPSTRTWSSPAAARARPTSRATTTSAGCPTTCSSSWSSRCGRCSRTRSARSGSSWGCRRRSSGGTRSPAPGWRIRIIGEVTRRAARRAAARPTRSPAPR